jgi:hypothetical protein
MDAPCPRVGKGREPFDQRLQLYSAGVRQDPVDLPLPAGSEGTARPPADPRRGRSTAGRGGGQAVPDVEPIS